MTRNQASGASGYEYVVHSNLLQANLQSGIVGIFFLEEPGKPEQWPIPSHNDPQSMRHTVSETESVVSCLAGTFVLCQSSN